MKVGDLVRIKKTGETAVIIHLLSFENGKNLQPVVMIGSKLKLYGKRMLEVINESW